MSATTLAVTGPLFPIRRNGARPGSLHAARPEADAWLTACGERLHDSRAGRIVQVPLVDAWALIDADDASLCRRCARVGDAVS